MNFARSIACAAAALAAALALPACTSVLPEPPARSPVTTNAGEPSKTAGYVRFLGGRYEGELRNGRPHGRGTFVADDGSTYRGEFVDGRYEGQGRLQFADGRVVEGRWANDKAVSAGLSYPDGSRFSGGVTRGLPDGPGVLTLANGTTRTGQFRNGALQGNGLQVAPDGRIYSGPFVNGLPNGEGICSGGGSAGVCTQKNGQDDTARALQDAAATKAKQQLESEAAAQAKAVDRELKPDVDAKRAQMQQLSARESAMQGPQSGDPCYCAITRMCITMGNANATAAERAAEAVAARQYELECRTRWADYLATKDGAQYRRDLDALRAELAAATANYRAVEGERQRRLREIDEAKRRQLADQAAMKARADAEQRKLEDERQRRMDEARRRCSQPGALSISPCACRAVLGIVKPPAPGSVCEA